MTNSECVELADAWIKRYELVERFGDTSQAAVSTYRTYLAFDRLTKADEESAWDVILHIVERTENEFVLENLAAGPLETLLGKHGIAFIDRIEARAAVDPRFRWLLEGVWQGQMPNQLWSRIQRACSSA